MSDAFRPLPCGCKLVDTAAEAADPRGAAVLRADGEMFRQRWGCPRAGCSAPPAAHQTERAEVTRSVARVLRMTDAEAAEEFRGTCPRAALYREYMGEVVTLHRWWKSGQLALHIPCPSRALLDAVDAVEEGLRAYESEVLEEAKRKAQRGQQQPRR